MPRHLTLPALTAALLAMAILATGCTLLGGKTELKTISEADGLFHIKTPSDWSAQVQPGLIAIYGEEEPPTSDKLENLSIGIFSTENTTDTPAPDALAYVVATRAKERGWSDSTISEPTATKIGGRDGSVVHVNGTDDQGVGFEADYYFIRTAGQEVLVIAAAPTELWEDAKSEVDTLMSDQWYWQKKE